MSVVLALMLAAQVGASTDPVAATRLALQRAKAEAARRPRAALMPRTSYLRPAELVDVRLAPDGRVISFLRRSDRGSDVMLQDVATGAQTRVATGLQRVETAWSGDGQRLWVSDDQGLTVIERGAAGATGGMSARRVLRWDARRSQAFWAVDPRAPRFAIIREEVAGTHRYLSVDVRGATRLLLEAELPLRNALLNADGSLAFTAAFDGARYETVIRQYSPRGPRDLLRCATIEECRLVGYNQAQQAVWVLSQHGEDKLALRRWRAGKWQTVHRDPAGVADAEALLWSSAREDWMGIAYHDGRRRWYGNGSAPSAELATLQRRLPEANLQLSSSNDRHTWLVRAQQSDRARDRWYVYHPTQNRLDMLFTREEAASANGSPPAGTAMHPVTWRASDGMLLHGYVLLPSGIDAGKAPLIAWLHGGPITRTYDQYEGSMQLLVNRGYVVFVPNFRASAGYGLKYVLAAKGDVGNGRVLADIMEGLDFLLAQGIGDRARQAVMGLSFGGYASLLAVTHHPSRFRFAFAGAPPTEYGWIKQWQADNDSDALHPEGAPLSVQFPPLGFPYRDPAWRRKMQRESPLAALPALRTPAYVWAGALDDHVPLKSIVNFVGEARRLDKPVSLLIDPDGGHGPRTMIGTEASLYLIELAAHRHLGGPLAPASAELTAFLRRNVRMDMAGR